MNPPALDKIAVDKIAVNNIDVGEPVVDEAIEPGALYVVATPIGNLLDITARAKHVLRQVAMIAAEDTRHTRVLLGALDIHATLVSCHAHNEANVTNTLLQRLHEGAAVALVSDAGTPLVSDPGGRLVAACHAAGLRVIPIPGASSVTAALSAAGFHADRYVFEGFLPRTGAERRRRFEQWRSESRTVVFFEAPRRVRKTMLELCAVLGEERRAAVTRELTKRHEQVVVAPLGQLAAQIDDGTIPELGEFVLLIAGNEIVAREMLAPDVTTTMRVLLDFLPPSQASRAGARLTGLSRGELYKLIDRAAEGSSREICKDDGDEAGADEGIAPDQ